MKFSDFLKDKSFYIISEFVFIIFWSFVLSMLQASVSLIMIVTSISIILFGAIFAFDFARRSRYYNQLYDMLEHMDKKQYIATMLGSPTFLDAQILDDVIRQATKAMNDEINMYQRNAEEYRDYIETWIHEVKVPISCILLLCENNKNETTISIMDETSKVEGYVEQALYYARSTNVEKDYSIKTLSLNVLVKEAVKKYSKQLIACKTKIQIENLEYMVYTDSKWLEFILGQIISNSIKYRKESLTLSIYAKEFQGNVILTIHDDGIGISNQDLHRVMEKGFTGENGRKYAKSTGIGLYLCKQLCDKMHLGFEIESIEEKGTDVKITFPKNKMIMLEN